MHFLKRRAPLQIAANEPRSHRLVLIRWLYLAIVSSAAIWIANFFLGDKVFFHAEGLVLGEPAFVAAEFPVTVRDILIREGQTVMAGDVAAIVSSQTVAETIARLTSDVAARVIRQSELRIRGEVIDAMLPFAENRQKVASGARRDLETLLDRHYLSVNQHSMALESEYRGIQDFETLKSEKRIIDNELATLGAALSEAEAAISDLRKIYDGGRLNVPMDSVVTRLAANRGSVVRSGEPLIELTSNKRFVLAYLPPGRLYDVNVGDPVTVKTGARSLQGYVMRVEPFAAALPREFQRAFTPVERQQVIRIEFEQGQSTLPLFVKVSVRSAGVLPDWTVRAASWLKKEIGAADTLVASVGSLVGDRVNASFRQALDAIRLPARAKDRAS